MSWHSDPEFWTLFGQGLDQPADPDADVQGFIDLSRAPEGARIVALDLTRRRVAERLSDEFQTGACHAGRFEGSVVLAERPELFREGVAARLEPNPASLSTAIREGHQTFEDAGGPRAYFGWPAEATAEEGHATVQTLGHLLTEAILDGETQ